MKINLLSLCCFMLIAGSSCGQKSNDKKQEVTQNKAMVNQSNEGLSLATFGSGCFWCTEAVFLNVDGVVKVASGYSGGKVKNPTYKEVCSGLTGHAEVIQVTYDATKVSYDELLEIFWGTHDPTTLNKQGADEGTQYRSVVFYHNDEQKQLAEGYKKKLDESGAFSDPIVTEISPLTTFYVAEDYHQNYYNLNGSAPYCKFVIQPKLEKFKKVFKEKLKKS
ncbi:peptide-methionine (S)-S-oxide reductase [Pseudochryseolinea flava]|uniref:Peptide methionine sulfoxide reductase MsrA n=2 Tax=Pseudochryseolinea flava TaxID=2059302 RepID=A0A364Y415_9BACT|nr:peptide-methionine (S)-S-oxide reductase MsrA [Pseudochryseolinea flava]RAW01469.1 peptide-methionine (S)-S-oxide reductase [Pseudochryseolinea flava]